MRIERCISPRPATLNASVESVSVTLRETSFSVSFMRRSLEIAGCDILSLSACKRGVVDDECHFHRRRGDLDERQRLRRFRVTDRVTDGDIADTGDGDDIAGISFGDGFL